MTAQHSRHQCHIICSRDQVRNPPACADSKPGACKILGGTITVTQAQSHELHTSTTMSTPQINGEHAHYNEHAAATNLLMPGPLFSDFSPHTTAKQRRCITDDLQAQIQTSTYRSNRFNCFLSRSGRCSRATEAASVNTNTPAILTTTSAAAKRDETTASLSSKNRQPRRSTRCLSLVRLIQNIQSITMSMTIAILITCSLILLPMCRGAECYKSSGM